MTSYRWLVAGPLLALGGACSLVNAPDDATEPPTSGPGGTGGGITGGGGTGGTPPECTVNDECDDQDPCTVDVCNDGSCDVESTTDPNDDNACTTDSCDPATAAAVNTPILPVDDGDACTMDFCDPAVGPVNRPLQPVFAESFTDNSQGWVLEGPWEIGPAVASGTSRKPGPFNGAGDPAEDHTESDDNGVAGVVIGGYADTTAIVPEQYLESPAFDGTIPSELTDGRLYLTYWRWLVADYRPFMVHTVEVFDGTDWQVVFDLTQSPVIADTSWKRMVHDVTPYANPNMKVRFAHAVGQADVYRDAGSWTVDDVMVGLAQREVDDGDLCTQAMCDAATGMVTHMMLHPPNVPVDDMDACTQDSVCDPIRGVNHYDLVRARVFDFSVPEAVSLTGQWELGPAMAGSGDPADDVTGSPDNRILGVNLGGPYATNDTNEYVVNINIGSYNPTTVVGPIKVDFQRWLNAGPSFETPHSAQLTFGFNGPVLHTFVQTGGLAIADNKWIAEELDFTSIIQAQAGSGSYYLRLSYQVNQTTTMPRGGWNIDDVIVTDETCMNAVMAAP